MSPKDEDEIRKLILERRARFLAAALATTGLQACTVDSGPSVCLSIAMTSSTSGTSSITATDGSQVTNTNMTGSTFDTCRNPPACVCLSIIMMTYPPPGPSTVGPVTVGPTSGTTGSSTSDPGESTLEVRDGGFSDAGLADGGVDAGSSIDTGTSGTSTSGQTTASTETTSEFTEPTVCLSIVELRRK